MLKALHPTTNQLISFKDYKEFLVQNNFTTANNAPRPTCPICHNNIHPRAGQVQDNGHFVHEHNAICPTKHPASRPYLNLTMGLGDGDPQANKDFVKENINTIFKRLSEIIPYLELKEFIEILKEAKRLNIYSYANLVPEYIPYVFVTLINFLPKNSFRKQRRYKFIFFYEDDINSFHDLWINNGLNSNLYRISYKQNISTTVTKIDTTTTYLRNTTATLSERQKNWCYREL